MSIRSHHSCSEAPATPVLLPYSGLPATLTPLAVNSSGCAQGEEGSRWLQQPEEPVGESGADDSSEETWQPTAGVLQDVDVEPFTSTADMCPAQAVQLYANGACSNPSGRYARLFSRVISRFSRDRPLPQAAPALLGLALACGCNASTGTAGSGPMTDSASDGANGGPDASGSSGISPTSGPHVTTGPSSDSGSDVETTTADTTGGDPIWPPPFVPTTTVEVNIDPSVTLGEGPCLFECTPSVREELPRVMDLCELVGGDGLASGYCDGGACPVAEEVCITDEFQFSGSYCALGGYPRAYCGAYAQRDPAYMAVSTRILHRLVGSQLVLMFADRSPIPAVQVYLQEGVDRVDEQGVPYPIPYRIAPVGGRIVITSADLAAGSAFAGTYELEFAWPEDASVTRTIAGHFSHTIQ